MTQAQKILKQYWNYDAFRSLQEEVINSVLEGNDTLALMPTGGGKSICFQVPALMNDGICIVVSPLIALMKDQVNNLQKKALKLLLYLVEFIMKKLLTCSITVSLEIINFYIFLPKGFKQIGY